MSLACGAQLVYVLRRLCCCHSIRLGRGTVLNASHFGSFTLPPSQDTGYCLRTATPIAQGKFLYMQSGLQALRNSGHASRQSCLCRP